MVGQAFQDLKEAFTIASILIHCDFQKSLFLKSNPSDFTLGAILSQHDEDGCLYPITLYLQKFIAIEINYEIYNKELLAIVNSFQEW